MRATDDVEPERPARTVPQMRATDAVETERPARTAPRMAVVLVAVLGVMATFVVGIAAGPAAAAPAPPREVIVDAPTDDVAAVAEAAGITYLGGEFTSVGAATGAGAKVDTTTGTVDRTFPYIGSASGNATLNAVVSDGAGGYYIGGVFSTVNGTTRNNAARIMADGSVDPWWDPSPSGTVQAIAVSGSTVYLGGSFATLRQDATTSVTRDRAAAVDAATGFATDWDPNPNNTVYAIAATESTVYLGGAFTSVRADATTAATRTYAAAVDATDGYATAWQADPGGGFTPSIRAIAITPTTVYLGGSFSGVRQDASTTAARANAAAVDPTTGYATAWAPDPNGAVRAIAVTESAVYLGGTFSSVRQDASTTIPRSRAAAVDTTNGYATAWNPSPRGDVNALAVTGAIVHLGGSFDQVRTGASSTVTRNSAAAVDASTGFATAWNPNLPSQRTVNALAASETAVYLGGNFTHVNLVTRNRAAAIDADGRLTAWDPNPNSRVYALTISGATVYLGGDFTSVRSSSGVNVTRNRAAAVDATTGFATAWNPNVSGGSQSVRAIAVGDSTVYLAGSFTTVGSGATAVTRTNAAAVSATTGVATAWNPAPNALVNALAVAGSTVYLGGTFTQLSPADQPVAPRSAAAAADATSGAPTAWDPNPTGGSNEVKALAVSGTTVYLGGNFTAVRQDATNTVTRNNAAAVDAASGFATGWDPNPTLGALGTAVNAIAVGESTVYLGGSFTSVRADPATTATRRNAAAVDATSGFATAWNPGFTDTVADVTVSDSGVFLVGAQGRASALAVWQSQYATKVLRSDAYPPQPVSGGASDGVFAWNPAFFGGLEDAWVVYRAVGGTRWGILAKGSPGSAVDLREPGGQGTCSAANAALGWTLCVLPWGWNAGNTYELGVVPRAQGRNTLLPITVLATYAVPVPSGGAAGPPPEVPPGEPPPQPEPGEPAAEFEPQPNGYQAVTPARFADTRPGKPTVDGAGPKGAATAGGTVVVPIAGRNGLPAEGVGAVAVNVTAVGATSSTYVTAWPTGEQRPTASTLNPGAGQTVANMAIVKVGSDGSISVFNNQGSVDVVVDVLGWFPEGAEYTAVVPARFADTRAGQPTVDGAGPRGAAAAGGTVVVPILGRPGVPGSGVGAVAVNVTAVGATSSTYVTAWPSGEVRPTASTLNPAAGQTVANMAIVKVGADGSISVFNNQGTVEVIVDVLGWFPVGADYTAEVPARFADTRLGEFTVDGAGPKGALGAQGVAVVQVAGRNGLPATGVGAVAVNITATGATESTYLTAWPTGEERPNASNVNPAAGQTVPNMAIVKLGADGSISVFNNRGNVHLIIDVLGWFPE